MFNSHRKNTVRYYLLLIVFLLFLFFSGDFGLIDVQKTAIVMAVGIDKEEDAFIVTSQIAVPQEDKQGKSTQTVQLVSRGKTVADAFEDINAKTGWYPKLVFCHLIILGEETVKTDAFDALDFFLLDEYMSDNCLLATCDGLAKDLLNVTALVDSSGSLAMQKVLSQHAERVGTVHPTTLREFAIGYFSESGSASLPVLQTRPQQEHGLGDDSTENGAGGQETQNGQSGGQGENQGSGTQPQNNEQDKPVFSASETALFKRGKRVGTLTKEETFALNAVQNDLRLATYTVNDGARVCSLSIKRNDAETKSKIGDGGRVTCKIELTLTAGLLDSSKSLPLEQSADAGDTPNNALVAAERLLSSQIQAVFEKCRASGCDLFRITQDLQKLQHKKFYKVKTSALENAVLDLSVRFRGVR